MVFFAAFFATLKDILRDKGVFTIMIIAPILYGLYYPWPYSTQIARHLPVAVVDHANDSLSRRVIRYISASPRLIVHLASNERTAKQQLLDNRIMAYMVIPPHLKSDVIQGKPKTVTMVGNGSYVLASKYAQQAMGSTIGTISAGIEIKRLSSSGLGAAQIRAIRDPVPLKIDPLHNKNEGYGSYVVPAVAWLILQQTLLMACGMLVGWWFETKCLFASPVVWLGRIAALSLLHYLICLGYTGWLFSLWGYESGGNPIGNVLLIALFSPCVAALGCLVGLLIKDRERALQLLVFSALPMFFVSGFSWPTQQLPELLQYLRWAFPSTSAIQAGVKLNQLGASIDENWVYYSVLAIIGLISLLLLLWFGRQQESEYSKKRN